jgi:hypothetical protein
MVNPADLSPRSPGKQHIFFAFTPFSLMLLEQLLERSEFADQARMVINTASQQYSSDTAQVINFNPSGYSPWQKYRCYRRLARMLRELRKAALIASVTGQHPHMLLSNALMLEPGDYPVNIYEDGIANYFASDNINGLQRKSTLKRMVAPCLGLRYKSYRGHISGIDERVMDNGYFLDPDKVYLPQRFENLHRLENHRADPAGGLALRDTVLVLDQDIESLFDSHTAADLRKRVADHVLSLGMEVQIKAHPSQSGQPVNWLGEGAQRIRDNAPAETVAADLRPRYVVSFFSSALKNIKTNAPDTHCISIGATEYDRSTGSNLRDVFSRFGIEVR